MNNIISKKDMCDFLINYHFLTDNNNLVGKKAIKTVFERLKSIQYDPLNVVGRNADLVLQSRIDGYAADMLSDTIYKEHFLIDGWDKEMCIYKSDEFKYFSEIRRVHTEGIVGMLSYRNQLGALDILDEVRNFINQNGLTSTKDISIGNACESSWGHKKLSSAALDYLYHKGELSVAYKNGVQKYFDFTENILPDNISHDFNFLNEQIFLDWYVKRRINCVGALWGKRGGAWQGHYLYDNVKRKDTLNNLCEKGEIQQFTIDGIKEPFYVDKDNLNIFNITKKSNKVSFLAPLDNLLWDRALISQIFGFNYSWEVYVPVGKRKFGYYVLPVLYGNQLIARFEPEYVKQSGSFKVKNWWWQDDIKIAPHLIELIEMEFVRFSQYLNVENDICNIEKIQKL